QRARPEPRRRRLLARAVHRNDRRARALAGGDPRGMRVSLPPARRRSHGGRPRGRVAAHHGAQSRAHARQLRAVLPVAIPHPPLLGHGTSLLALGGSARGLTSHHGQGPRRPYGANRADRTGHPRARRGPVRRLHRRAPPPRQGRTDRRRHRDHADPRAHGDDGGRSHRPLPGADGRGRDLPPRARRALADRRRRRALPHRRPQRQWPRPAGARPPAAARARSRRARHLPLRPARDGGRHREERPPSPCPEAPDPRRALCPDLKETDVRRNLTVVLAVVALTVPSAEAMASVTVPKAAGKKIVVSMKTFTGSLGRADRWGDVQVTIVVKKTTTTTGTKKTVKRHIESIKVPVYPDHTGRSVFISEQALPRLIQEALQAQSTHIYIVSGATYTSDAFGQSLQAAITKEKAW